MCSIGFVVMMSCHEDPTSSEAMSQQFTYIILFYIITTISIITTNKRRLK